ncbi:hypothetical protein JQ098_004142 [Salmonella enterica subsp. enterica serovar Typhimurium]|uniref:Helix-turn-helix domain-containing protein n=5 Tax=Salmonella enterica I TaxID=59201 RepID=A0A5X5WY67_SALEB|nr:hypothetical protein [Salmonella enterica]EAA0561769.1 hypothetical protein [Salmonella enterica subsp. enterica serovar Lexington]EAA3831976.1 hypothetical protein [Salmonella enterica subsp. enterica serovar Java]EBF8503116.1 hypothetical protein [Salmonella enterica subsp. enterica serovar Matopeni]EBG5398616.1 hypothetical protein [Salmonella enterica subsp. enterica serovar Newport]EBQ5981649.1 hypothetical protein [Salmonella enterica subsp. houtenae serovar Houten]EBS3824450.1 hypot
MNKEMKENIIRLKRSGMGYKAISRETEININTVKSICRRSGLFCDNPEHRALFTIPEPKYSTELATIKPLPPQQVITGHKQTDAYLWVLEVIKTGEPAHIAAAETALSRLMITPKEAQERYTRYLQQNGAGWTSVFSTMWLDNPQHFISKARLQWEKAARVRGAFGSHEAVFEPVPAECLIESRYGSYREIYCDYMQEGDGEFIYTDVLPAPYTLSDVVREYQYWDWLSQMRVAAHRELYPEDNPWENSHLWHRENWLEKQLENIRPVSRGEALDVLKWYLESENFADMGRRQDGVYLNLIGSH